MKVKGNADPKPRPLSSAILGPVDDTSLLRHPPQEKFFGGWSFAFRYINPRLTYHRKTPWIFFHGTVLITNYLRFYCVPLRGLRLASPIAEEVPPLCAAFFRFR